MQALHDKFVDDNGKMIISFLPVQKQPGTYNSGLFKIAFAAEVLDPKSPTDAVFDVQNMQTHLIQFPEIQNLVPFSNSKLELRLLRSYYFQILD